VGYDLKKLKEALKINEKETSSDNLKKQGMKEKQDIILAPRHEYDFTPEEKLVYDIIVIGAGIAGYSAAMYASRLGLKVLVAGELPGGKITSTDYVENYPGFVSINGIKLAELIENHAKDYDIDMLNDIIENLSKRNNLFVVSTGQKEFKGKTAIIATGTVERKLNVPGEEEFRGNGVSYCALCDATFAKDKDIVIVGGGDSAVKEAVLLANYAKKIHIININSSLRAEKYNMENLDKLIKEKRVIVFNSSNITSINGKSSVESVSFTKEGKEMKIDVQSVFIYIGQKPRVVSNDLGIALNKAGEIIVNEKCETNVEGVYAAGDVTSASWKQAIIAAAQGVTAAYSIYNRLIKRS